MSFINDTNDYVPNLVVREYSILLENNANVISLKRSTPGGSICDNITYSFATLNKINYKLTKSRICLLLLLY